MTENQITHAPLPPPAQQAPVRKKPFILFRIVQWVVVAFFALLVIIMASDIGKLSVPGAPVALFWVALAVVIGIALIHSPPAFFRLPRIGKILAYLGILAGLSVFGSFAGQMNDAYSKTPEGAKEAAAKAATAQQAANDKAAEDARLKVEQDAKAREMADQKIADLDAQKPGICKLLVDQMIEQSKSGGGVQIIEVNNVAVEPNIDPLAHPIACSGDAITSRGNTRVEFGLEHTPQGKDLLSFRFP